MDKSLHDIALALVAPGKGILAADESAPTIKKRFDTIGLESTEESRRAYREMLLSTAGIEAFISGVILFDETIRQPDLVKLLTDRDIMPGIKVDKGTVPMPGSPDEVITQGLDGLSERLAEYAQMGAKFTKWRAVIKIWPNIPTDECMAQNAQIMAQYAKLVQAAGLVPIVEPEVLMDGDHDIGRCQAVTEKTLQTLFAELEKNQVDFSGLLLKINMVLSGKSAANQATAEEAAQATVATMQKVVPAAVPGIVFLSGGQSAEAATAHLNAMNKLGKFPWQLSFSYGRALQGPALETWRGQSANLAAAQAVFHQRAKLNSLARTGSYTPDMEAGS